MILAACWVSGVEETVGVFFPVLETLFYEIKITVTMLVRGFWEL